MRVVFISLITTGAVCVYLLASLFFGAGSYQRVVEKENQLQSIQDKIAQYKEKNDILAREILFLQSGKEAIEEQARYELNMIDRTEVLFKIKN